VVAMLLALSLQHACDTIDCLIERGPELAFFGVCHDWLCSVYVEDHLGLPGVLFFSVGHFGRGDPRVVTDQFLDLLLGAGEQLVRDVAVPGSDLNSQENLPKRSLADRLPKKLAERGSGHHPTQKGLHLVR